MMTSIGTLNVSLDANHPISSAFDIDGYQRADGQRYAVVVSAHIKQKDSKTILVVYPMLDGNGSDIPLAQWEAVGSLKPPSTAEWTGCNRVRVHSATSMAFFSCFGKGTNFVGFVDLTNPAAPTLTRTVPFVDEQPTGMLVVGDALFVAGGVNMMVFNVTDRSNPSVIATCESACSKVMLSHGQNAHSLAYERRVGSGSSCQLDRHLVYLTAQIDNRVGAVEVVSPALVGLLCSSQ
jgi:hypothetical protein